MSIRTQIILILITLFFFVMIVKSMKKSKMSSEMATNWIGFLALLIIISIFPQIPAFASKLMGIHTVINAVFLVIIFLMICMLYYLCVKVSILNEKVKNLIQEVSLAELHEKTSSKNKE